MIDTSHGPVYFGGDTGYGPHFKTTGERFGPFALAIIPIGAYEPRWFMKDVHLNPAEASLPIKISWQNKASAPITELFSSRLKASTRQ